MRVNVSGYPWTPTEGTAVLPAGLTCKVRMSDSVSGDGWRQGWFSGLYLKITNAADGALV